MSAYLRIGGALTMGLVLILGAFVLSRQNSVAKSDTDGTIVQSVVDREYIEARDSNNDGVEDWRESLTARVIDSITLPSTTPNGGADIPYEKPVTFTGKFAEAFMTDYLSNKPGGEPINEEDKKELIKNALVSVERNTASTIYTPADILTVPDSDDAFHTYGNEVADIIKRHSIQNENEAVILKRALDQNDPTVLKALGDIREVYSRILADSLRIAVPESLANGHAALLTGYAAIRSDIEAMEKVFTDPLLALARIQTYEKDALGLYTAIKSITTILISKGVSYEKTEPGALMYLIQI